jgi:hypothetical protein
VYLQNLVVLPGLARMSNKIIKKENYHIWLVEFGAAPAQTGAILIIDDKMKSTISLSL